MNLYKSIVTIAGAFAITAGCGSQEEAPLTAPVPSDSAGVAAVQATPNTAAPVAPPVAPPPAVPSASADSSAASPATGTTAATTAAVGNIDGDPLAYYRYDSEARRMDDLGALQNAINAYNRSAGLTFTAEDKPKPPLAKLEDLVANGALRGIPAPPAGKRYVFDAATQKVTAVAN